MEKVKASLTIRQASVADAHAIAEIHVAGWRGAYRDLLPRSYLDALSVDQRRTFWQGALAKPGASRVTVSEDADGVTGFCSYGPTRDDDEHGTAEIYAIYVQPAKWRQGAGRALCELAFRDAAERACTTMTAWVFRDNRPARDFYEHLGFSGDGAARSDTSRTGSPLHEMRYRRRI
jgi:RimJ/RimL family protein N-acetyltransferase